MVNICIPSSSKHECGDLIDLNTLPNISTTEKWLPDLKLNENNKTIITDKKWLNDKHVQAVCTILWS